MPFNIAMVTGGLPFNGATLEEGSLGGSETAFLCMARELAKRGHVVHAFCNCPKPGIYDGVAYHDLDQYQRQVETANYDVVISSRWPEFLRETGRSGLRVLWCHDVLVDPHRFMGGLYQADLVMLLSQYHLQDYKQHIPEVDKFTWLTKNGIDTHLINQNIRAKVPGKVIFTSRPERGLYFLLGDILPRLLKERPELQLYFCNYSLKNMQIHESTQAQINASLELAASYPDNVINLGHLTKAELYQHISSAELVLYPTDFPEISCISAIEAQACGTGIITTKDFALVETIGEGCGELIPGPTNSEGYVEEFVAKTLAHLGNVSAVHMGHAGQQHVLRNGYTWEAIAQTWEEKFHFLMQERWDKRPKDVLTNLLRYGDLRPAEIVTKKYASGLENMVMDAVEGYHPPVYTSETLKQAYADAQPRLQMLLRILALKQPDVDTIVEYRPGAVSLGLCMAKVFPDAQIQIVEPQEDFKEVLVESISKANLDNVSIVTRQDVNKKADLVVITDCLEQCLDPQSFLKEAGELLSDSGYLVITSAFGPLFAKAHSDWPTRRWCLDYQDYRDIFRECGDTFAASFHYEGSNEAGEKLGHWCVVSGKASKYHKIDMNRKRLSTRPYEYLSACIITGEEEDNIAGMLKSIDGICDEIIVIDTRPEESEDRSAEIALAAGAIVQRVEFDNFAQVRNESLELASGDWVIWIDTDERLTNPENLRKYLSNNVYEGYALRQVHLTVDSLNRTFDIPVRLLRNRPHYRFTGLVHEHCEDVSVKPFDSPITPRLLLPDVDIAHFGYLTENVRRRKCSNRNMRLLQRALREQPERKLNWVLAIRDYLNMLKWETDGLKFAKRNGREHQLLEAVVDTFKKEFPTKETPYYKLAYPMYQEALSVMGKVGFPYKDSAHPPFEIALALAGSNGALDVKNLVPDRTWFLNAQEFLERINREASSLCVGLGIATKESFGGLLDDANGGSTTYGNQSDAAELLSPGIDVF
jgi:glycosyltransferase involved in cell wall biosynthesis